MAVLEYRALDGRGRVVRGLVDAIDETIVLSKLRDMGFWPIRVAPHADILGWESSGRDPKASPAERSAAEQRIHRAWKEAEEAFSRGDLDFAPMVAHLEDLQQQATEVSVWARLSLQDRVDELHAVPDPELLRRQMREKRRQADEHTARMTAGDPRAYADQRWEIAPGWLTERPGERYGVLCLGGNRDLVWVDQEHVTMRPTAVTPLCTFEDFEGMARRGLLRNRAVLRASGERCWTIRLDRRPSRGNVKWLREIITLDRTRPTSLGLSAAKES